MFFSLQADDHNKCGFHQCQMLASFLHVTMSKQRKSSIANVVVISRFSFDEMADNIFHIKIRKAVFLIY